MGIDYMGYGYAAIVTAGGIFGKNSELYVTLVKTYLLHLIGANVDDVNFVVFSKDTLKLDRFIV